MMKLSRQAAGRFLWAASVDLQAGNADASELEPELGGTYTAGQFTKLSNHEVCAKLLVNGQHGEPFLGRT